MNRFQFVADHRDAFEVKRLCEIVQVARSSFYAWLAAAPVRAVRASADTALAERIRKIHQVDNALAESFNATLKRETLHDGRAWPDPATCRREVFRWVTRYNTRRRHSWCGQQSPISYEQQHAATLRLVA